jgi:hypothetical protein
MDDLIKAFIYQKAQNKDDPDYWSEIKVDQNQKLKEQSALIEQKANIKFKHEIIDNRFVINNRA